MIIGLDGRELQSGASGDRSYWLSFLGPLFELAPDDQFILSLLPEPGEVEYPGRGRANVLERRLSIRPGVLWTPVAWPRQMGADGANVLHAQYLIPPLCRLPTIVTIHDVNFMPHPEWTPVRQLRIMRALIPLSARRASCIVTGSQHAAGEIARWCRVPREKIRVVDYAVSERFCPGDAAAATATAVRHGLRGPFVLAVGLASPRKNIARLVRAFALLAGDHPELRLALVGGEGGAGSEIRAAVDQCDLADQVVFCGRVPDADLPDLYRAAALLAYPSLYEGFGLPALEAAACGTPVVAAGNTSVPEVIGEAGLLVDPYDIDELAAAMRRVIEDAELAAKLRAAGPQQAARFTRERLAAAHLALYRELGA